MEDWQVDVAAQTAEHSSGLQIVFEGRPQTRHFSGTPSQVPKGMPSLQLVRLIREGYQAYEEAYPSAAPERTVAEAVPAGTAGTTDDGATVKVRRKRPRRRLAE